MTERSYGDPAPDPRQTALDHASPDTVAVVAALVYIGDMLGDVRTMLETLDVTVHNGLVAITED